MDRRRLNLGDGGASWPTGWGGRKSVGLLPQQLMEIGTFWASRPARVALGIYKQAGYSGWMGLDGDVLPDGRMRSMTDCLYMDRLTDMSGLDAIASVG